MFHDTSTHLEFYWEYILQEKIPTNRQNIASLFFYARDNKLDTCTVLAIGKRRKHSSGFQKIKKYRLGSGFSGVKRARCYDACKNFHNNLYV